MPERKSKKSKEEENLPMPPDAESELPPDADIEEKFNDFWKRNGLGIFGGILLGAVLVVGVQTWDYLGEKKEDELRESFSERSTAEEKLAFAEENPKHHLAGMAYLEVADSRFEDGEFERAAELYGQARDVLEGTEFRYRAQLGQGISLLRSGEREAGTALIQEVAANGSILDRIREEAAYHLAVIRWEQDDLAGVEEALDIIFGMDSNSIWSFRAQRLQDQIPELASASGEG